MSQRRAMRWHVARSKMDPARPGLDHSPRRGAIKRGDGFFPLRGVRFSAGRTLYLKVQGAGGGSPVAPRMARPFDP